MSGSDTQDLPERWVNTHVDARAALEAITVGAGIEFLEHPTRYGLLLAPTRETYIVRVGVLFGAHLLTREQAAALVRGMGVTILNPDEGEEDADAPA